MFDSSSVVKEFFATAVFREFPSVVKFDLTADPRTVREWRQRQVASVKGQTDMADYVSLRDQRRMRLTLPAIDKQREINQQLASIDAMIAANRLESEKLAAIRDLLLPPLISGELRVPDLDVSESAEVLAP